MQFPDIDTLYVRLGFEFAPGQAPNGLVFDRTFVERG